MGCCLGTTSDSAKARDNELQKQLEKDHKVDSRCHKLLLLGAGESGKSTLFKQCRTLYGRPWERKDFQAYLRPIHSHVIFCAQKLCENCDKYGELPAEFIPVKEEILAWNARGYKPVTEDLAGKIARIWALDVIQETYKNRAAFQIYDAADYFLDRTHQIAQEGYVPSYEDMLRARRRTTGIIQMDFKINGQEFHMLDVGGQQSERSKWLHCFDNVSALLWVCAISSYNLTLFEDGITNRIFESLNLFEQTINTEAFEDTAVILFMNKSDLFKEKIKTVPLTHCFPEYKGDNSYDDSIQYIQEQFRARIQNTEQMIFPHVTCAMDKDQMFKVFKTVKHVVIRKALRQHVFV